MTESVGEDALPEGWAAVLDPGSGASYYYHAASSTTSWDPPVGGEPEAGEEEEASSLLLAEWEEKHDAESGYPCARAPVRALLRSRAAAERVALARAGSLLARPTVAGCVA